jgi:hypothetical protein
MTWGLARFVASFRPSAIASPASFQSRRAKAMSGPVPITDPQSRPDGLRQADFRQAMQEGALMARRQALISTIRKLRRDHRATCSAMADLRRVTHDILAMGEKC